MPKKRTAYDIFKMKITPKMKIDFFKKEIKKANKQARKGLGI